MSYPALILGESGSGKSASLRKMDPTKTLLIQAIHKPLPFEDGWKWTTHSADNPKGNVFVNDRSVDICTLMQGTKKKVIIIDDWQYILANEFMRRSDERGYDKFTEIGRHAWDVCTMAAGLPSDVRVYIMAHTEIDSNTGRIKVKTIGKMLDEKITVEGMFTTVLRTVVSDGKYYFSTRNSGFDSVKSPMGMFSEALIDNDLNAVDQAICKYCKIVEDK